MATVLIILAIVCALAAGGFALLVSARGFRQVSDQSALDALIDGVLAAQPAAVADVRKGQGKAMGFLVGQVMQASGGKANPKVIRELLGKRLGANS